jgi:hypothetical protein
VIQDLAVCYGHDIADAHNDDGRICPVTYMCIYGMQYASLWFFAECLMK